MPSICPADLEMVLQILRKAQKILLNPGGGVILGGGERGVLPCIDPIGMCGS